MYVLPLFHLHKNLYQGCVCIRNQVYILPSPAGHIIGGVVGGVIGGILLCCVLPCVCVCCLIYWTNRQTTRPVNTNITSHPVQPTSYPAQPTSYPAQPTLYPAQTVPYQPYMPPPTVQTSTFTSQPQQSGPQPSAPPQPQNAELYNAEPPPPYPAMGYSTFPTPPQAPVPGYVEYEQKATDFPGQDT